MQQDRSTVGIGVGVTREVQGWVQGRRENFGFVLSPEEGAIDKNENTCTGYWFNPRLEIRVLRSADLDLISAGLVLAGTFLTLAISDVPGNDPETVGSGPTVADPTTLENARAVIARRAPCRVASRTRLSLASRSSITTDSESRGVAMRKR